MMKTLAALGIAALLVACGKTESAAPAAAPKAPAAQGATLSGTVLETMNGGGYTYMKIKTANGESWVATPQAEVKTGQQVTIVTQMTAKQFESSTLQRKFDEIVFGTLDNGTAPAAPSTPVQAAPAAGNVKVEKAAGANAKTVAEIWSGRTALRDQPVVVRGTVVKFLGGIMGKNWLHLRDGSGSEGKGDHDLTVTTNDTARVGDVVVVSGTVRVDKDFGSGYHYAVIVEDASVK